jgi:hypothetical protein
MTRKTTLRYGEGSNLEPSPRDLDGHVSMQAKQSDRENATSTVQYVSPLNNMCADNVQTSCLEILLKTIGRALHLEDAQGDETMCVVH